MLAGSLTDEQIDLLHDIVARGSVDSLSTLLVNIELDWFQTFCLGYSLVNEGCIVTLDTGLGKTYVASANMQFNKNKDPKSKFIFICERGSYEQTIEKIKSVTTLSVVGSTGEDQVAKQLQDINLNYVDVVVLTYQAVHNMDLANFLIKNKSLFCGIIVDECQHLNDVESYTFQIINGMCKQFKKKLFLSATPFTVSPVQVVNQLNMIDPRLIGNTKAYMDDKIVLNDEGQLSGFVNLDKMNDDILYRVAGFTRKELGIKGNYKVRLVHCVGDSEDYETTRLDMNKIKGKSNSDSFRKLKATLTDYKQQGKYGILYCNTNENKRMLLKELTLLGFRVGMIDGTLTKRKDRPEIQKRFNNGEFDVLIINITTSLDLPCDFVMFWELTLDWKQTIGRGERGLQGRDLSVDFFIVDDTCEVKYFIENVYNRSVYLREVLGKDNDELIKIKNDL